MQPILAESAPPRGRALVLAAVLTVAASIAAVAVASPRPHPTRWHRHHHHLPYNGQCPYGYVYSPASSGSVVTAVYVGR